jgi:ABC-type uncharacterized transport system fused permease/ATPase subunit
MLCQCFMWRGGKCWPCIFTSDISTQCFTITSMFLMTASTTREPRLHSIIMNCQSFPLTSDQRLTQDVNKMCNGFSQIVAKLLITPFTIIYYTYQTWNKWVYRVLVIDIPWHTAVTISIYQFLILFSRTGYLGPLCVVIFFIISTIFNKFLMSAVVNLVYKQEQREGDFRCGYLILIYLFTR